MGLMRQLDNYCERLGPEFWAEPVNAVTNIAFIAAALLALRFAVREGRLDWPLGILIAITTMVGIGSFLFHTFATVWAVIADVIPIQLFIVVYFALAMRRFAGLAWWLAAIATVSFMAVSFVGGDALGEVVGERLNGSEGYIPPLLALMVVGAILIAVGRDGAGWALVTAGALFALSLSFRTADMAVCDAFPLGTHFMWHTLNGVLLGYLLFAMVRHGQPGGGAARPS